MSTAFPRGAVMPKISRRFAAGAVLLVVAASAAVPGLAQAKPQYMPVKEKCKPGALWQDENGKVIAVCDKNNRWVKVIRLETGGQPQTVIVPATTLEATS
jgi:hypothetical protein